MLNSHLQLLQNRAWIRERIKIADRERFPAPLKSVTYKVEYRAMRNDAKGMFFWREREISVRLRHYRVFYHLFSLSSRR